MKEKRKNKRNIRSQLTGVLEILGIGISVATILGFLGRLHWALDLFSHFRVQYFQLCLILIGIALWRRQHKRAIALVMVACLNYAFVLPLYFGKPAPPTGGTARAMLMNINAANGNTEQVLEAVAKANPDILLFEEVTPKWESELAVLGTNYPHRIAEAQDGCFGIMLLSKYPLSHGNVIYIGSADVPSIMADVHFPQGELSVIGTHPLPPIGKTYSRHRNNQLAKLPALVKTRKHPVLLIGDLNASPWSAHFTRLVRDSGLKNSMKGFGFQPSWPSGNRFLRIPIDHVLHSPKILIHNRAVGSNVGSDHFPVIVDFSIR
ncbi:MAG: endonuclease/exonuclease/phosphatase family protein [Kiritimatiellales bacterium]|nr:endonuclease/exonuclease/phosphatase family protein [Kiritimatiellales bacterium]